MGRPSKEFQAFDHMVSRLLTVPKSELLRLYAAHREKSDLNPRKRGRKQKVRPPSATDPGEESGNG